MIKLYFQCALKSLFRMFRNGMLPYFYVCSEVLTIVFKNQECILWPGNSATKAKLETSGIQFREEQKALSKQQVTPKTPKKSRQFGRSSSVTEEMLLKTPTRSRKDSCSTADEDEDDYAKTPDIKMKNYRRVRNI